MRRQIQKVLDHEINPSVAGHGGRIELVDYLNKNVYIQMLGGCQGCASSQATLRQGVERILRQHFGEDIVDIFDVTEHEKGQAPYFSSSPFS